MKTRSRRFACGIEMLEPRIAMAAGIDSHEVYSWQIINLMRADPSRFANDLDNLYRNQSGTYQGYKATDPVWTELRSKISSKNGVNGWTFSGMLSFLRSQPKLPKLLLQEDLTIAANNHTLWMQAHGYGHTGATTRGDNLPGMTHTTASSPDAWDHPSSKYSTPSGENISYGYNTEWAFEVPYKAGTMTGDAYRQRLAYLATLSYILDAGQPDLGHLRNLLARPDGYSTSGSGNKTITNMDSIGIDQTLMRYQQPEDVPNYYLTTHRLDNVRTNVARAGQYSGLSFTDSNKNGLYDVGEAYTLQTGGTPGYGGPTLALAGPAGLPSGGGIAAVSGSLAPDDVQIFRVVAPAASMLTAQTSAIAGGRNIDTILRLFDAQGREIASDDDGGANLYSRIDYALPGPGTYYVGVSGFGNSQYDPILGGGDSSDSYGDFGLAFALTTSTAPPATTPPGTATPPGGTPGSSSASPPQVVQLQTVRRRRRLSAVTVQFDSSMDESAVTDLGGYRLQSVGAGKKPKLRRVRLIRAAYDSNSKVLTLSLARPLKVGRLRIVIDDSRARGANGLALAGGDYTADLRR